MTVKLSVVTFASLLKLQYTVVPSNATAIAREKQIKGYRREKKTALIQAMNPGWKDLYPDLTA